MTRRSPLARACLMAVALLQLTLSGAVAWADARLDTSGPRGPIHVETQSTTACIPVHPGDCILHRYLSTPGSRERRAVLSVGVTGTLVPPLSDAWSARAALLDRLPNSRAPPAFS